MGKSALFINLRSEVQSHRTNVTAKYGCTGLKWQLSGMETVEPEISLDSQCRQDSELPVQ